MGFPSPTTRGDALIARPGDKVSRVSHQNRNGMMIESTGPCWALGWSDASVLSRRNAKDNRRPRSNDPSAPKETGQRSSTLSASKYPITYGSPIFSWPTLDQQQIATSLCDGLHKSLSSRCTPSEPYRSIYTKSTMGSDFDTGYISNTLSHGCLFIIADCQYIRSAHLPYHNCLSRHLPF